MANKIAGNVPLHTVKAWAEDLPGLSFVILISSN
jgi:hypothetical protein